MIQNVVRNNVETRGENTRTIIAKHNEQVLLALGRAAFALGITSTDLLRAQRNNNVVAPTERVIKNTDIYKNMLTSFMREQVISAVWKAIAVNDLTDDLESFYVTRDASELIILAPETHDLLYEVFDEIHKDHGLFAIHLFTDNDKYLEYILNK